MSRYVSDSVRREVAVRANFRCEYCGLSENITFFDFQVDHIISVKHGGPTHLDNLAWACYSCNIHKGSDVGTVLLPDRAFIRLFNPRIDTWPDHFAISDGVIHPKTLIGEATIKVLRMNEIERVIERK